MSMTLRLNMLVIILRQTNSWLINNFGDQMQNEKYQVSSVRYNDIYGYYVTIAESKSGSHMQWMTTDEPFYEKGDKFTIKFEEDN